jgi:hypothetical protein
LIAYLEQLEQDLVEAIERREAAGERAPGRLTGAAHSASRWLTPRPAWLVAAALAVLIVAGVALVGPGSRDERAVQPAPSPEVSANPPGTVLASPELRISGDLIQVDGTTWRGRARGPGGTGTLTLTDAPQIPADAGNEPQPVFNQLRFRWEAISGTLEGCADTTILRRPYGRFVWDGPGTVSTATGSLKKYRGSEASIGGRTMVSTPEKAYIGIGNGGLGSRPRPDC